MTKFGKILGRLLLGVLIIAVILSAGGLVYFGGYLPSSVAPKSFPQIEGTIHLQGLDGPVEVYRDDMGIPHIYAASTHDLFFTQGFVHAQDRFWQMDAWRHIGSGTLSEMFGAGQIKTDTFLRTLGWREVAQAEWDGMKPGSKSILQAYADGVNAYLKDHSGAAVSLEYAVLQLLNPEYKIAPWTPVNSLTWGKAMAWDLRGNMNEEIERAVLLKTLTPKQIDQLFPPYPSDHPVIISNVANGDATGFLAPPPASLGLEAQTAAAVQQNLALMDAALGPKGDGVGSNSWVISGSLTSTGKPILANDPHLGIQMPSIWYQVDLHCQPSSAACPFDVAGFSFAGVPGVVIGHNENIAWGFTNTGPDVMDLFVEKVNPANPNQYEADGKWVDFQTRKEVINVSDGSPVTVTVRSTRHGPVISDSYSDLYDTNQDKSSKFVPFKERAGIFLPQPYVIALEWTALQPSSPFEAIWQFDAARNWDDFRNAARSFHVPAQNLVYADVQGNIGYQMPGEVPIRKSGDGRYPVPGWSGDYDWTGYIPFDQLPHAYNPPEGFIVTANNEVVPPDYPYLITEDWDYGFRANRIVEMIKSASFKINQLYVQKMQGDMYDSNAAIFVPLLLKLDARRSLNQPTAIGLLKNWDYTTQSGSAAAAVFEAFWRHLLQNTFDDDLPPDFQADGGSRWNEVMRNLIKDPKDPFWDDKTTKNKVETMDDVLAESLTDGVNEVEGHFGGNVSKWKWGVLHAANFRNQTLGDSGIGLIERLFNRGPFQVGGSEAVVDATGWSVNDGYETNWIPSMRMVVDLGALGSSVTVHTTGQSGHAFSKHYDDMAPLWSRLAYYPMLWEPHTVYWQSEGHLRLLP
ncbi:MAG TPA: penicillin acylase family protein [Anaerolineales bacterium]|nr:penicillin acylase family protein [Anaerolineales bacterium]